MDDEHSATDDALGGAPESVAGEGDKDDLLLRCETERDTMTPKETSDCAGAELADTYENEEDGGS